MTTQQLTKIILFHLSLLICQTATSIISPVHNKFISYNTIQHRSTSMYQAFSISLPSTSVIISESVFVYMQATGYASQHIWCLSQTRINWEGCARKGIWHKNGGDGRGWAPISQDGVALHPDCWCICLFYLHFVQKIQKMANKDMTFGHHPMGPPHAYANRRWGNPARTQHNTVLGRSCVNDDLRADGVQKGWGYQNGESL